MKRIYLSALLMVFTIYITTAKVSKLRLAWTDNPTSTITIGWDQECGANSIVYYDVIDYGTDVSKYSHKQIVTKSNTKYEMKTKFAELTELTPSTNYYFVIKDSEATSSRYWFKTAPNTKEAFTFIEGGDTKSSDKALVAGQASNRMVAKLRPLFVLFSGDYCEDNGTTPAFWKQWLNDWFTLTTSVDGRMYPIVPVHGNHENGDYANLTYIFNTPYQYNNPNRVYYSLSFGNKFIHITVLNTEYQSTNPKVDVKKQLDWLINDLSTHKDFTFKFTAYHRPFRAATKEEPHSEWLVSKWEPIFQKYKVNISFEADAHVSSITYPIIWSSNDSYTRDNNGIMYVGQGTWGANPRPNDNDTTWTIISGAYNQIKWVHVLPDDNGLIKIYTVITGNANKVTPLTEENLFDLPRNINIVSVPEFGKYVPYPINEN